MTGIGGTRFRKLTGRNPELIAERYELGASALDILERSLDAREFLVGDGCSIADVSIFAYTHVAGDAGYELTQFPAVSAWLGRMRSLDGFMDDLQPYPDNARPGRSRSIYD